MGKQIGICSQCSASSDKQIHMMNACMPAEMYNLSSHTQNEAENDNQHDPDPCTQMIVISLDNTENGHTLKLEENIISAWNTIVFILEHQPV